MRIFRFWLIGCFLAGAVFSVHAVNRALDLIDSHAFYQMMPRQGPLAEQLSTIINSPANALRVSQKRAVRIALLLFGDVNDLENKALLLTFRKRMRELSIDYRLDTYHLPAKANHDLSSYLKVIDAQPDYIITTRLGAVQRRFIERFLMTGKPKVIVYDFSTPLIYWMNHPPLMYLGFDQKKATMMLASYLDRQLPPKATLTALVLQDSYLGHMRCDLFLDEMVRYGRNVKSIMATEDDKESAFNAANLLIKNTPSDFIFSCSKAISEGVIAALEATPELVKTQTNTWGLSDEGVETLESSRVKASVLFMEDNLAIAAAEAIKLDLEGRNMPNLYVANSALVPAELDAESMRLMVQQAFHYSVELWSK